MPPRAIRMARASRSSSTSLTKTPATRRLQKPSRRLWKDNLGIDVEIAVMDWATMVDYRKTSDCEIARQGWIGDYSDPATFFDLFVSTAGTNDGHYKQRRL